MYRRLALGVDAAYSDDNKLYLPSINTLDGRSANRSLESEKVKFLAGRFASILLH